MRDLHLYACMDLHDQSVLLKDEEIFQHHRKNNQNLTKSSPGIFPPISLIAILHLTLGFKRCLQT